MAFFIFVYDRLLLPHFLNIFNLSFWFSTCSMITSPIHCWNNFARSFNTLKLSLQFKLANLLSLIAIPVPIAIVSDVFTAPSCSRIALRLTQSCLCNFTSTNIGLPFFRWQLKQLARVLVRILVRVSISLWSFC